MATKLGRKILPAGHSKEDFQCFGPPATKDGEGIVGTMLCDMGFFGQDEVDSNKFYHSAVVQSKKDGTWFAYFEWGRQGATSPDFLFLQCSSKEEAQKEYVKQTRSKNDKRGEWVDHPSLGRILQPKKGGDCYLVRAQATRCTGLPDAKTITVNEGVKPVAATAPKLKSKVDIDPQTLSLMRDLNVGTVNYTRSAMSNAAIPTQPALDFARSLLTEALKQVKVVGPNIDDQVNDKELKSLTQQLYGRIPKKKDRGAAPETWILSGNNINAWQLDLDAFENALHTADVGETQEDPFNGMKLKMSYLSSTTPLGRFVYEWWPSATRGRHSIGRVKIKNVWEIELDGQKSAFDGKIASLAKQKVQSERPLHQPAVRPDLDERSLMSYVRSGTWMLLHGTRTVNTTGILRTGLRLPRELVGVAMSGAAYGPGIYWADDIGKSIGYTSYRGSYYAGGAGGVSNRGAFMFIADVALGTQYLAPSSGGWTKAPNGYHSVFAKAGHSGVVNNEFIIYSKEQHRMRYLVEFDRA